jgi:pilus assembly protein CpaC
VSIGQPEVADVNPIGPTTVLVTAKKPGSTQLILWDDDNRSQVIDVNVIFDRNGLQEQMQQMFPTANIEVTSAGDGVILRGQVPNLETAEQAVALATPHAQRVMNFLEIAGGQQVMLQVRFAEVSRSATSSLGVNLGFTDGTGYGASNIGQVNPFGVDGATDIRPDRLTISNPNPAVTVFGRGQIGSTTLAAFINALRQNNLLRMLAEPNLIAISGQEAHFLAGGEFPIPVTQGGGTDGNAITIEYREFGVRLRMVPVVLGDGRIRLKVAPEVSDLDFTTAVRFNGFVIPGLTSRKVETTVELNEGQTFAIAGLLNNSVTATKDVTPLLGDLPVLGALFRSVRYNKKETELVVMVTPRLVEPLNPADVPLLPGEQWRDPNELELFLNQDVGGETSTDYRRGADERTAMAPGEKRVASRYVGEHGFVPTDATASINDARD